MPINPYQPIKGSTVVFKIVLNIPAAEYARAYVKKTDGTLIMPETDMDLVASGVYKFAFQIPENLALTTYNVYATARFQGKQVRDKQSFTLKAK